MIISTSQFSGDLIIQGNTQSRSINSGASLEFVIPADNDGSNPLGPARIITIAGNANTHDATSKLILGTRHHHLAIILERCGTTQEDYYRDQLPRME
jgi:hypothetical protein